MAHVQSPFELPPGRARRDLLAALDVPLRVEDFSPDEQVDLFAGLERLRGAILARRAGTA